MRKLTSEQANRLADDFLAMARAVADYRYLNSSMLSDEDSRILKRQHEDLLECVLKLYSLSPEIMMEDAETSMASISSLSARISQSFKNLENVPFALELAANVVVLGDSITSQEAEAMSSALNKVIACWGQEA